MEVQESGRCNSKASCTLHRSEICCSTWRIRRCSASCCGASATALFRSAKATDKTPPRLEHPANICQPACSNCRAERYCVRPRNPTGTPAMVFTS